MRMSAIARHSTYFLLVAVVVATLSSCSKSVPIGTTTEAERVTSAFDVLAKGAQLKDGLAPMKLTPKLASRSLLPNGVRGALWVAAEPTRPALNHCFYLEFTSSKSSGTTSTSSCGGPTESISLNRIGLVVIGDVGSWPATRVLIAIPGSSVDLPVTKGYFLVPSTLTTNQSQTFKITLLDAVRSPFAVVRNLSATGSGVPDVSAGRTANQLLKSVLTPCSAGMDRPSQAIPKNVVVAVYKYYKARNLLPIRIQGNHEKLLNLNDQSLGRHWCNSGNGIMGAYDGEVPLNATQAVMVLVEHSPYKAGNRTNTNFLTIAMIPGTGWRVVGENTGP